MRLTPGCSVAYSIFTKLVMIFSSWCRSCCESLFSNESKLEQGLDTRVITHAAQLYIYDLIHSKK
jgi:hypothetical protein